MVFTVPRSKRSIKQNQFEFKMSDEEDAPMYSIPLLKYIRPSIIFKSGANSDMEVAQRIFDEYLPETFGQFEDTEQLEAFMQAWKHESGIDVGESSASPS